MYTGAGTEGFPALVLYTFPCRIGHGRFKIISGGW